MKDPYCSKYGTVNNTLELHVACPMPMLLSLSSNANTIAWYFGPPRRQHIRVIQNLSRALHVATGSVPCMLQTMAKMSFSCSSKPLAFVRNCAAMELSTCELLISSLTSKRHEAAVVKSRARSFQSVLRPCIGVRSGA